MNRESLRPFRGFFSPGLYFSTGYAVRLYNFTSAPTEIDAFFQIWMMTPEGRRILYIDPEAANEIVSRWYRFEEVVGANIDWYWHQSDELRIELKANGGVTLDLSLSLGSSLATDLLNAVVRITPRALMRTPPMLTISQVSFNLLLGLGGVKIVGQTETGNAYVTEAEGLAIVREASARLNGKDLGKLGRPPRPLYFGPSRVADRPIFARGTANLEYDGA